MKSPVWAKAIKASADPKRARHFAGLLSAAVPGGALEKASVEQTRILTAVFAGSETLGDLLATHPDWLTRLEPDALKHPRRADGLRREAAQWLKPLLAKADYGTALQKIRELKQAETLRIAARDLAGLATAPEIIREISDLADFCLSSVWDICERQQTARFGTPHHADAGGNWSVTPVCVLGLGKLGGQELNYSSDVDVMFLYAEEGGAYREVPAKGAEPRPVMTNHQYFNRLAESFIAECTRLTDEGTLYRMDLRLRPEGDTGPLTRSMAGYENYYAQWGQTWERMMLLKARGVAGDRDLAAEFLEMIQPFRYPRSLGPGVLREIAAMKARIENEVVRAGELERNVKLGRGGIREIEFVAQTLQLLHAGRQPFLQTAQTLPAIEKLQQYEYLTAKEAATLTGSYSFLRNVEHRLQMEAGLQTHTIPSDQAALERLARLMGFDGRAEFDRAHQTCRAAVRAIFDRVLQTDSAPENLASPYPAGFEGHESDWTHILSSRGFRDPEQALRRLQEFVEGPGFVHVSPRTSELARQLLPRLFSRCPETKTTTHENSNVVLSDPDRVVTRLDSFISAYGARATLFELWNRNPNVFDLLVLLFDRSEFLAELAIRVPDIVDSLVTSGRLRQAKTSAETLRDLRHGLADADQHAWLRRYHETELMRIGLRDILGVTDYEQYLIELSALADACLQYALEIVQQRHGLKSPPFTVVGLGKLGGEEIDYGSDLDLLFVCDARAKDLAKLAKIAAEFMDLLSRRTEQGIVFHTDARLRPDGEKGLLVNTLAAYEEYYRSRAQLWELQSLTRTRAIAGEQKTGALFQSLAGTLTDFRNDKTRPETIPSDWKQQIHRMRMRIEKERTPRGQDALAIKTGSGGLVDAEFVAQALCLENGWREANTLRALERANSEKRLPAGTQLIAAYRHLRRVEGILRRWSYEGETVLPDEPAPYHRVAIRCGFAGSEEFRRALEQWRREIRTGYQAYFGKGAG